MSYVKCPYGNVLCIVYASSPVTALDWLNSKLETLHQFIIGIGTLEARSEGMREKNTIFHNNYS